MIATGACLKDRYRLERLLGRGGMASVWLANDEVLDRPVAVKVLSDTIASDPEFTARFRREARIAASLSHPNLIGVYDYAEGEERPYLVMEYVPGANLAEARERRVPIDCEGLARQLLGALAHIHAAGIVHRDVKPQNVLIAPGGETKLIDFGIALPKDATALTRTGNLLGTARYIAPEVMSGEPATERSDLYSCGVVLRDCLGEAPEPHLRALVERLSVADPQRRPASATEALARLERRPASTEEPTQAFELTAPAAAAPPTTNGSRPAPSRSRPIWGRVAAVIAVCAALAAAFVLGESLLGGDDPGGRSAGNGDSGRTVASGDGAGTGGAADGRKAEPEPEPAESPDAEESNTVPAPEGGDPALGSSLNQEGFELIQSGDYEGAVPVLEEAVRAFPPGTEELDYAYALFNLGNALRLAGRPEEAIPVLERRLEIPNQTDVVQQELEAARTEADS